MALLTSNYSGRTIDILMLTVEQNGIGEVELYLDSPIKVCTGLQKLAQRFIILLLNDNTLLGEMLKSGNIPQESLIKNYIIISIKDARNAIITEQDNNTPDDEYLIEADLGELNIKSDSIDFSVNITTKDNSTYTIPLSV